MAFALTRAVSPAIRDCQLTHHARVPIDVDLASAQHAAYEEALDRLGFTVLRVEAQPSLPDAVFVEDTAVVLPELAIITRPGAVPRRDEVMSVAEALAPVRALEQIAAPGTLDGGDVLRLGSCLYVGQSGRTNIEGVRQLRGFVAPFGYEVQPVTIAACLHLKSAVTAVAIDTVLMNPEWVPRELFADYRLIEVDPHEPSGGNALLAAGSVLYGSEFPATAARLLAAGIDVRLLDLSELAKAEGAVTCCSVLVE